MRASVRLWLQGQNAPKTNTTWARTKVYPPQLLHGGVGGGVHVDRLLLGWGGCSTAGVSEACEGGDGEDGSDVVANSGVISVRVSLDRTTAFTFTQATFVTAIEYV